ncbi:FHA domain-containing protein [Gordonia sp. CPCC 205515]|uniref:FHA domain-containing protein n=1 Tax=Gordonia sp. CPCC 205515 TaxID=3140791 RepID=UPI003AF37E64
MDSAAETPATPGLPSPRVTLVPGAGMVVRASDFVCVAAGDALDATGDVPRVVAEKIATGDGSVDIAFVAVDATGLSVHLRGAVFAEVDGRRLVPPRGRAIDRMIGWPIEGLGLYLDGVVPDEPGEERFDLIAGAVPAAGALLHTPAGMAGTGAYDDLEPARPDDSEVTLEFPALDPDGAVDDPVTAPEVNSPNTLRTEVLAQAVEVSQSVASAAATSSLVRGIRCARGHLNDPRAWACAVCGLRMDEVTARLVVGERPPLGWLLLDNGTTVLLDEDLVIGREPESGDGRRRGGPRPISVVDETGEMSRRHVAIKLIEWSVQLIDLGSANGTFVSAPRAGGREFRVPAHRPQLLLPGSRVRIGGRHFVFESPHARG